jgi:tetratricopeptide (TPR) repeat protein
MSNTAKYSLLALLLILIVGSYFQDITNENTFDKAQSLMKEGDYLGALVYLNYCIEKEPEFKAYFLRAECMFKLEKYSKALDDLQWIRQSENTDPEPVFLEAKAKAALNDTLKAVLLLDSISDVHKVSKNADDYSMEAGRLLLYQKDFQAALSRFEKVKEGEKLSLAYYYKGVTYRYWADKFQGSEMDSLIQLSIQHFDKSIMLDKDFADSWFQKSLIYAYLLDEENCLASISKAIEIEPDNYFYYFIKGNIYVNLNYCDDALKNYNKAIALNAGSEMVYRNRAEMYLKCFNDSASAEIDVNYAKHIKNKQRKRPVN